jgi:hypothetical protein
MAVGTVSGVNLDEQWQLISSTTASGTSMTFNGFTGYKHIWIVGNAITKNASTPVRIRPNNDTAAGSYAWAQSGNDSSFYVGTTTASAHAVSFKIYNIDQAAPHKVESVSDSLYNVNDAYVNPVAITSIVVYPYNGTASFTGGTFSVYGVPA